MTMFIPEVIQALGHRIYDEFVRGQLTEYDHGRYVVVDVTSSKFAIGDTPDKAAARLRVAGYRNGVHWVHQIRLG